MGAHVASAGRDVAPRRDLGPGLGPGLGARAAAAALIGLAAGRRRDNDRLRVTVAE